METFRSFFIAFLFHFFLFFFYWTRIFPSQFSLFHYICNIFYGVSCYFYVLLIFFSENNVCPITHLISLHLYWSRKRFFTFSFYIYDNIKVLWKIDRHFTEFHWISLNWEESWKEEKVYWRRIGLIGECYQLWTN